MICCRSHVEHTHINVRDADDARRRHRGRRAAQRRRATCGAAAAGGRHKCDADAGLAAGDRACTQYVLYTVHLYRESSVTNCRRRRRLRVAGVVELPPAALAARDADAARAVREEPPARVPSRSVGGRRATAHDYRLPTHAQRRAPRARQAARHQY